MEVKLFSLKNQGTKTLIINESFWENVEGVVFHSEFVEFRLKKGRSPNYLHNWFYEVMHDPSQNYSEDHRQSVYNQFNCAYRFPKDNEAFIDALYTEAKHKGLLTYP